MAGISAAYALALHGWKVDLVESGPVLGGLAGSFHRDGRAFPLGYHHILHRDHTLLYFLDRLAILPRVRWRQVRMVFRLGDRSYDLSRVRDMLAFPMGLSDKARFAELMVRAFRKSDWRDWDERTAAELIDAWASPGVRQAMFEPLTQIKFGLPCSEISASWLGARLHQREGSAPLGYLPEHNWTEVLCEALTHMLLEAGVHVSTSARIVRIATSERGVTEVTTEAGAILGGDVFVSTIPTEILIRILPGEMSPNLRDVTYTALTSVIAATRARLPEDFYWMNLVEPDRAASGLFLLNSLNPTLGQPGETYANFVTHTGSRNLPFFRDLSEEQVCALYAADFRAVFGQELAPRWVQVNRVPMYSPVFVKGYRNPPVRSTSFPNLYFAGNFRTHPSVASTGTALQSGLEAAQAILGRDGRNDLWSQAPRFRLAGGALGLRAGELLARAGLR